MHAEYINYTCALLSLKTMALWIYTLIISTYFFNKNGFSWVCLFFRFSITSSPFLLFSSTFLLPSPLPVLSLVFLWIYPRLDSNSHSWSYLCCPSPIPLHHGDLLTFSQRKIIFMFTYQSTLLKFNEIYIWITSITKTRHLLDLLHEKMIYFVHPLVLRFFSWEKLTFIPFR